MAAGPAAGSPAAAAGPVDRTVACTTQDSALRVFTNATNPIANAAGLTVATDTSTQLFGLDTNHSGYVLDGGQCHSVKTAVPLERAGLPSAGIYLAQYSTSLTGYCPATARVLLHVRVGSGTGGKPAVAKLSVWTQSRSKGKTVLRALSYIQWSPQRVETFLASRCTKG